MKSTPRRAGMRLLGLPLLLPAASLLGQDCNRNGVDDDAEIRSGASPDCNRNGRPDSCDLVPAGGVLEPSGSTPTGAPLLGPLALADFDGDGHLDAIASRADSPELTIHRGGAAGFTPGAAAIDAQSFARIFAFAAADLTGDGLADVALIAAGAEGQTLQLRRSTGGGFAPPEALPGPGTSTPGLLAEDLDGDQRPEIVEAAHQELRIHWNDGGAFGEPLVLRHLLGGYFLHPLDVDGDGDLDLLAVTEHLTFATLFRNQGARSFASFERYELPDAPRRLATGDLDGDGDADLLLSDQQGGIRLVSAGPDTFVEFASFAPRGPTTDLLASDLDGDGAADAVLLHADLAAYHGGSSWVEVRRRADDFLVHARASTLPGGIAGAAAADLDGDGDADLAVLAGGDERGADSLIALANRPAPLSGDTDADGVPDECRHSDCNANGSPDARDIAAGTSLDCDADALPDECEPDCNADGEADDCDLGRGESLDRDGNAIPDECESTAGDCDRNGIADRLDLDAGRGDCDGDGLLDTCEIEPEILLAADFTGRIGLRSRPGAVTAADLDGDGDLDAAFAGRAGCGVDPVPGSVEVVLNLGRGRLVHAGEQQLDGDPLAIAAGDFENDGDSDLLVLEGSSPCRLDARASVLLNRGRGAFDRGPVAPLPATVESFTTGDFDGDRRLDLAAADRRAEGGGILVLRSQPGGFTESAVSLPGGAQVVAAGDLNGDQVLDLAAGSATRSALLILFADGGTFVPRGEVPGEGWIFSDLSATDLDGDRDVDLVAVDVQPGTDSARLRILDNDGAGGYIIAVTFHSGRRPSVLEIADVDGDRSSDLLVLQPVVRGEYGTLNGGFITLLQEPIATLPPFVSWLSMPAYLGVSRPIAAAGDWDEDGKQDLLVADGERRTAAVLRNSGRIPHFFVASQVPAGAATIDLEAADLDGDGDVDVAAVDAADNRLWISTNEGGEPLGARPLVDLPAPRALSAGDLDGDGDADLAVAGQFSVLLAENAGQGSFAAGRSLLVGSNPIDLALADLDGDGDLDLATANNLGSELEDNVTVFRNLDRGRFAAGRNFLAGNGGTGIEVADMDGDGDRDLIVSAGDTLLLRNDGAAGFSGPEVFASGSSFRRSATGDIDGDRDPDVIANAGGLDVIRNRGDGRALAPERIDPYGKWVTRLVDVDLDQDLDLATLNGYGDHWLEVLRNDGRGSFAAALIFEAGQSYSPSVVSGGGGSGSSPTASAIAAGDFDGDGDPDLALGLLMRGWITIAWNRTRAAEPDADGDGLPDSCGAPGVSFRRSDVDGNGATEITDAVRILRRLFLTGEPFPCAKAADADDDGQLNITDAVRILRHLFLAGEPPPAPYPACGPDPTGDDLACAGPCGG